MAEEKKAAQPGLDEVRSEALLYAGKARTMAGKLFNDPKASQVEAGDLLLYMAQLVDRLCLAAAPAAPEITKEGACATAAAAPVRNGPEWLLDGKLAVSIGNAHRVSPFVVQEVAQSVAAAKTLGVTAADGEAVVFDAAGFRDWVKRELPDDTIIGSSAYWADHLTAWAQRFVKAAPAAKEHTDFDEYWVARWLDTKSLMDDLKATPVREIARQAWEAALPEPKLEADPITDEIDLGELMRAGEASAKAKGEQVTLDAVNKAWNQIGADLAGLKWSDFAQAIGAIRKEGSDDLQNAD